MKLVASTALLMREETSNMGVAASQTSIGRGPRSPLLVAIRPIRVVQSPESCPVALPSKARSLCSGPGIASDVQDRRWSPRRCWPQHAPAPDAGTRLPLFIAILVDPHEIKPRELPSYVPERAAQPVLGPGGCQRGPGPMVVRPPMLAATRTSTRRGPPIAALCRHPGRPASF